MSRSHTDREQLDLPSPARLQYPGKRYQCGHAPGAGKNSGATPCSLGPTATGECPLARLCQSGTSESDSKNQQTPCRPIPTWAGRRRLFTVTVLLVFAFALVAIFGTPLTPHFVKPGELSSAHAQILTGDLTIGSCTVCHGNVSAESWLAMRDAGHVSDAESLTMTQRCVACHHNHIPADLATSAHNLTAETRVAILNQRREILRTPQANTNNIQTVSLSRGGARGWIPPAAISADAVACSVCHREHHGSGADLKTIADARCQTCHSQKFGSFADSHPEFRNWPIATKPTIAFDHARHANIHFPKAAETSGAAAVQYDCRGCHAVPGASATSSLTDPIVTTLPFEIACAGCHDDTLKIQIATGPALIELPILPVEIARQIESWPATATGSPDGKLSAWMLLLLQAEDPASDFSSLADLSRVDWQSAQNQAMAVRLATAIRQFAIKLSLDGQTYLQTAARKAGADEPTATALARSFPTQLMRDAVAEWFGKTPPKTADGLASRSPGTAASMFADSDLLVADAAIDDEDSLLDFSGNATDDALSTEPAEVDWEAEIKTRFDAARAQSLGGWYRDDLTLSVRYRGNGHGDAVLRSLIEITARRDTEFHSLIESQPATAACLACHTGLPWRVNTASASLRDQLTRFSHRPHLDIAALQNCQHCHTESSDGSTVGAEIGGSRDQAHSDFIPLTKAACAHCHTPQAAGDHCTTCHRYHVGNAHANTSNADPIQPVR
jgi:hypothetical protein